VSECESIRRAVSGAYARAVTRPCDSESSIPRQKGFVVKLAGYSPTALQNLPADAVVNSFGCGNPLAYSEVREGDVVLDLGSGAGIDLLLAARMVGPGGRAIGVDMTDEMLAMARKVIDESGLPNVEVRKGLIEDLPVESGSVDWVISNCVINLSPEKDRVFAEIARVLRPGGRMLVSDIVVSDLPASARRDVDLYCSCIAGAISEEDYADGLRRAGLTDLEIRERIGYDTAQLCGLIEADLAVSQPAGRCCSTDPTTATAVRELAVACEARVWSAKIFARKPA